VDQETYQKTTKEKARKAKLIERMNKAQQAYIKADRRAGELYDKWKKATLEAGRD
jgi:hypothetical protein